MDLIHFVTRRLGRRSPLDLWPSTIKFEAKAISMSTHMLGKDEVEEDAANRF